VSRPPATAPDATRYSRRCYYDWATPLLLPPPPMLLRLLMVLLYGQFGDYKLILINFEQNFVV